MKQTTTIFTCIIALSFIFSSWMLPHPWKEFISTEGKFRVMIPGKLTQKSNEMKTPIGTLTYHTYLHQPEEKDADNLVYMVSYCEYPRNAIHSDSLTLIDDFFETTVGTAVASVDGELQYNSNIKILDYPGRIWKVAYNEGEALIKTKAYLVNNRYYSIQTIMLKDKSLNFSADKFLDSFQLID